MKKQSLQDLLDLQRHFESDKQYTFTVKIGHTINGNWDVADLAFSSIHVGLNPNFIGLKDSDGHYLGLWGVNDLIIEDRSDGGLTIDCVPCNLGEDIECRICCKKQSVSFSKD